MRRASRDGIRWLHPNIRTSPSMRSPVMEKPMVSPFSKSFVALAFFAAIASGCSENQNLGSDNSKGAASSAGAGTGMTTGAGTGAASGLPGAAAGSGQASGSSGAATSGASAAGSSSGAAQASGTTSGAASGAPGDAGVEGVCTFDDSSFGNCVFGP